MLKRINTIIVLLKTIADLLNQANGNLPGSASDTATPRELIPWIGKEDVKKYFDIKESAYYRWVEEGTLKPRGRGDHRYYVSDILKLMEQRGHGKRGG